MKLNPIFGKGSGKVGGVVFAVSGGEQIVKEKPASVSNPNTDAQVEQRAKLKLMSQLAADIAPAIIMRKEGLVSARNKFIKKNIGLATYANGVAEVELEKLQITDGTKYISEIGTSATQPGNVTVQCAQDEHLSVDEVVYNLFQVLDDDQLAFLGTTVISTPGTNGQFPVTMPLGSGKFLVLGYGLKEKSGSKGEKYGNYAVDTADKVAELIASKSASLQDYDVTMTQGGVFVLAGA